MRKHTQLTVYINGLHEYRGTREFVQILRDIADELDVDKLRSINGIGVAEGDAGFLYFSFSRQQDFLDIEVRGGNVLSAD